MGIAIHGEGERLRYEARRKLFLAQMLIQIDQSRIIQDGPAHRAHFEEILNEGLWKHTKQIHDLTVGYRIGRDGYNIEYTSRPATDDMRWDFRSTFLEKARRSPDHLAGCPLLQLPFQAVGDAHQLRDRRRVPPCGGKCPLERHAPGDQRVGPVEDDPQGHQQSRRDRRHHRGHVHRQRQRCPDRSAGSAGFLRRHALRLAQRHRHPHRRSPAAAR